MCSKAFNKLVTTNDLIISQVHVCLQYLNSFLKQILEKEVLFSKEDWLVNERLNFTNVKVLAL